MDSDLEKFIHLYHSEKRWVLSITELDQCKTHPVTFTKNISPQHARLLALEMTKPSG